MEAEESGHFRHWQYAVALLLVVGVLGLWAYVAFGGPPRACTKEARFGPTGALHRDPSRDCQWVDGQGNVVSNLSS